MKVSYYEKHTKYTKYLEYLKDRLLREDIVANDLVRAKIFHVMGIINHELGTGNNQRAYYEALNCYKQSSLLYQKSGERLKEAQAIFFMGLVHDTLGHFDKALYEYKKSLIFYRQLKNLENQKIILKNIGRIYYITNQKEAALSFYLDCLLLINKCGKNLPEKLGLLIAISHICVNLKKENVALAHLEKALLLANLLKKTSYQIHILYSIAIIYNDLNKRNLAIRYYEKALNLHRLTNNNIEEFFTLNEIGDIFEHLKDQEKALDYYDKALSCDCQKRKTLNALKLSRQEIQKISKTKEKNLDLIASICRELGHNEIALNYCNEALFEYTNQNDTLAMAKILNEIGLIRFNMGDSVNALSSYRKAFKLYLKIKSIQGQAVTIANVANMFLKQEKYIEAEELYIKSLELYESTNIGFLDQEFKVAYADVYNFIYLHLQLAIIKVASQSMISNVKKIQFLKIKLSLLSKLLSEDVLEFW